jgi:hypothetical protein
VFESWVQAGSGRFDVQRARELTIAFICALEGAFVLARAQRSTEPLTVAGEMVARAVEDALSA